MKSHKIGNSQKIKHAKISRSTVYILHLTTTLSANIVNIILYNKCVTKQWHMSLIVDFSCSCHDGRAFDRSFTPYKNPLLKIAEHISASTKDGICSVNWSRQQILHVFCYWHFSSSCLPRYLSSMECCTCLSLGISNACNRMEVKSISLNSGWMLIQRDGCCCFYKNSTDTQQARGIDPMLF